MSLNINGWVIRPARMASSNAVSTGEVTSGVSRDTITPAEILALGYDSAPGRPVEPWADMYRAGVLEKPAGRSFEEEYLLWATSSSSLSVLESESFALIGDPSWVTPSAGSLTVNSGAYTDGTKTFFVQDSGGRDLAQATLLRIRKKTGLLSSQELILDRQGDASPSAGFVNISPSTGKIQLNQQALIALGGGFSPTRGDSVLGVEYILAGQKFWWSKNDSQTTRFGWNGANSRWEPLKGSVPQELGAIDATHTSYTLNPPPTRFALGSTLPGEPLNPEEYALIRVGVRPDSSAKPLSVLVVSDEEAETGVYPVSASAYEAVVGVSNGVLLLNPSLIPTSSGIPIWYNPETFTSTNDGVLGALGSLPQDTSSNQPVLSPVPGPTDRPLVRIGSRKYLEPIPVDKDSDLPLPSGVSEGEFYWSVTTGKIVLSVGDLRKAVPGTAEYDISYLGAKVYYDGVSLTQRPLEIKAAAPALNENGDPLIGEDSGGAGLPLIGKIYIPRASPLPPPGGSGVLYTPDGSGDIPRTAPVPQTRPNGSGISRTLDDIGDAFLFCKSRAFETLRVEEYDDDIPKLNLKIKKTEAVASRLYDAAHPSGVPSNASRCDLRRRGLRGEPLYFLQAQVAPSVWSEKPNIYSRYFENWELTGTETLPFSIDGNPYLWDAALLPSPANGVSYTAQEIVLSLNVVISLGAGVGKAVAIRGRICIQSENPSGSVEIGWNSDAADFSGHAVLGFLPAWRVSCASETFRWLPDCGLSFGLRRSPENLDRSSNTPDFKATASIGGGLINGEILYESISGTPWITINNPPLEDVPGYDEGVHFMTLLGLSQTRLKNWGVSSGGVGVHYEWENLRFGWTKKGFVPDTLLQGPTNTLQLGNTGVFQESLSSSAMAPTGTNFGLYLQKVGETSYTELLLGEDFVSPGEGASGQAILTKIQGSLVFSGGGGDLLSENEFWNPNFSLNPTENLIQQTSLYDRVEPGFLLQILNGETAQGVYTIVDKAFVGGETLLEISPAAPGLDTTLSWRIFEAQLPDVYDPTLLADVQQVPFYHFDTEPWTIRVLSPIGTVPSLNPAVVTGALSSGRDVSIRFSIEQNPPRGASACFLVQGVLLGVVRSTGLVVPDVTSPHFKLSNSSGAYFHIRVGSVVFSLGAGNLAVVGAFTGDPDKIEVGVFGSGISGQIVVGSTVLSEQAGERAYWSEIFLDSNDIPLGEAEIDPSSGEVRISSHDASREAGVPAYFVENLVVRGNLDAQINPLNGSFYLRTPLREFQIVETQYWVADSAGNRLLDSSGNPVRISEYLALTVRLERATRISEREYAFNPTGRTVVVGGESIWVGTNLQNFAGSVTANVNANSTISFHGAVDATREVQTNYRVLEAFGGEVAFTVSSTPVYRKPFFLEAGQNSFLLASDRTEDVVPEQLLTLGGSPFYIKSVSFNGVQTEVDIFPTPRFEVGSRSPGREAEVFVTNVPVDPTGPSGFLLLVDSGTNPVIPTNAGNTTIPFFGDVTTFAKPGHLLDIAGIPYLIVRSDLVDGGRYTNVEVSTPTQTAHASEDTVRISVRRIYSPQPTQFEGISPFLSQESHRLFLLGLRDETGIELPGKELVEGVHYTADADTGGISFVDQNQEPLQPWERLAFSYVGLQTVSPEIQNEALLCPRYKAQYLILATPTQGNRLLGSTLAAKYTFRSPDSFYCQVLPLQEYLPEVAKIALGKSAPLGGRTGGPVFLSPGPTENSSQGILGLRGEVQNLEDQDRAARAFVEFYNKIIVSFEGVLEAIDGRLVGDKDGKFRFFIGRGKNYAPPGWEDEVSGKLNERLIWREIVDEWSGSTFSADNGWFQEKDPVFDPTTAEVPDPTNRPGETDGTTPNPQLLDFFTRQQTSLVKNDMDDRVLVGFGRPRGLALLFPGIDVPGLYKGMWENHPFSRLFPERTKHFSRLLPGIGAQSSGNGFTDPGYYTAGRKVVTPGPRVGETTESTVKTRLTAIGAIANPALGEISGILEVTARNRYPRARVWRFYPQGSEALDSALNAAIAANYPGSTLVVSTVGKATLVLTPLTLGAFPLDPESGFPDITRLIFDSLDPSNPSTGSLYSIESGDQDLSTPRFETGQRVQWGKPDGVSYALSDSLGNGIFVGEVLAGCVITLSDVLGSPISGDSVLVNSSQALSDIVTEGTGRGDTLFVGVPVLDLGDVPGKGDSPTVDQSAALGRSLPDYAIQKDLIVQKGTGQLVDASWPTYGDVFPLPLQNWFGQNPPKPLTCIEGEVDFSNTRRKPLELPCLKGEGADDSGDVSIPYLGGDTTELDLLGEVATGFQVLLGSDSPYTPFPYNPPGGDPVLEIQNWKAIYPDEIVLADGEISPAISGGQDPATLYTTRNSRPTQTSGYTTGSGVGDARRFDLILVEADQGIQDGMTGILSIGETLWDSVTGKTSIEVPRFVTPAPSGSVHKYTLKSAWGHVGGAVPALAGIELSETHPANWVTTLDFSTLANFFLDDGTGSSSGGVLGFLGVGRALVVRIYDPDPGATVGSEFLGAVVLSGPTVWVWDALTSTATSSLLGGTGISLSGNSVLQIETLGSLLSLLSGVTPGTLYDFSIDLDAYLDLETSSYTGGSFPVGSGAGSMTCEVGRDRLTFSERVSLLSALSRGTFSANGGTNLSASLDIQEIQTSSLNDCTVNSKGEINGGAGLTFLERLGPSRDVSPYILPGFPYVGTFVPATGSGLGDERGTLRAMSWEGQGNIELASSSGIKASAIPSSDLFENSADPILEGTGTIPDDVSVGNIQSWVQNLIPNAGSESNVVAGDLLVVDGDWGGGGAVKSGTYLIRHVISNPSNQTSSGVQISYFDMASPAGSRTFLDLSFPTLKSLDGTSLVASGVPALPYANSPGKRCGFPDPIALGSNQWVYVIVQNQYAEWDSSTATYTMIAGAVYRAEYSDLAYTESSKEATFLLTGTYQDATGAAISAGEFSAKANVGKSLSGMLFFPTRPRESTGLPENNSVGAPDLLAGTNLTAGFFSLAAQNKTSEYSGGSPAVGESWQKGTAKELQGLLSDAALPAAGRIGVRVPAPEDNTSFIVSRNKVIYARAHITPFVPSTGPIQGVPAHVSFATLNSGDWDKIHFDGTSTLPPAREIKCLLPGDSLQVEFWAIAGIFLEPSFSRPTTDLNSILPHVVSKAYTSTGSLVGIRSIGDYTGSGATSEDVHFYVRRIRRFHEVQTSISDSIGLLKWGYEMRRGSYSTYNPTTRVFTALSGPDGATNLGDFTDPKVGINSGDVLRILDAQKGLLAEAEIQKVISADALILRRPGLDPALITGAVSFEIYLTQPLVPQEQSCAQLLDLITDQVVLTRLVDYSLGDLNGGKVPTNFNVMQDSLVSSWASAGVQEGDYVLIDPAGTLYLPEEVGVRPVGDTSVEGRAEYVSGTGPNPLDDNRGFYRVSALYPSQPEALFVSGSSRFGGGSEDGSDDVIFGDSGIPDSRYAVLPTIHGSPITGSRREGQASLRLTAPSVGGSFADRTGLDAYKSIEPFSYKILRPSPLFSQDSIELVLFMRERMLSWVEETQSIYKNGRGGDYWVFQDEDHIKDVGSPTDPADGKGVVSNLVVTSLQGLISAKPFANTSDCLSILDRRFWVLDSRLDAEGYTQFAENDWGQRPVLPDLIDEVLNTEDRFRPLRYSWISFRGDKVSGSIVSAKRAVEQLPEEIEKQQEYLDQKKGLEDGS